jgi:hypothetical protein
MKEHAVVFGIDSPLVGIATEPDAGREEGAPVFLLLNAGIGHRVGPNRLYVALARTLAESGLASLRFDFSGIGDSPASRSLADPEERAVGEAIQAMDFLGRYFGAEVFVPVGLCSGADVGFALATRDERVAGGVLINATAIPCAHTVEQVEEAQKRAEAHHYAEQLTHRSGWARVFTGRSDFRLVGRAAVRFAIHALHPGKSPAKSVDLGLLPELNRRGVELLAVYTEGDTGLELLKTHVGRLENLSSLRRLQLEVLTKTDHVLTPLWAQRRLQELVLDWTARRLSVGQRPARQFASRTSLV